jgi:hypothetical protein
MHACVYVFECAYDCYKKLIDNWHKIFLMLFFFNVRHVIIYFYSHLLMSCKK